MKETFTQKQNKKNHSKTQLDEKNLPFLDAINLFIFLYFSSACPRRSLPYIIKDHSSEGL